MILYDDRTYPELPAECCLECLGYYCIRCDPCEECKGTGWIGCERCGGSGVEPERKVGI